MYISNITCDKDKVNEMKLLMLMLMNAWMMLAFEIQMLNEMLNTEVLQRQPSPWGWPITLRHRVLLPMIYTIDFKAVLGRFIHWWWER